MRQIMAPDKSPEDEMFKADEMITVKEVAKMLGKSPRSVRRHSKEGIMPPPVKIHVSTRWRRSEVQRWLDDGCPPLD
jgi:predicted DNA-binding transcriptional regulator AlpA